MSGIEQIGAVAANAAAGAAGAIGGGGFSPQGGAQDNLGDLPSVSIADAEATKSISTDFSKILETYRAKSERVDTAVLQARSGEPNGPPNQREMLKQLGDLYTYAVDTQLLVRTSGQLTSGVRQLVTGQ
jgi:hypothetical protein